MIDAHHHLWIYSAAEYGWIDDGMQSLRRDFLPADLQTEMRSTGVDATIVVQARQTLEETRRLLHFAQEHPFIAGVVGWAALGSAALPSQLEALKDETKLKGLRHVLQDEADDCMLRDDFNRGISALQGAGLVYDLLIYGRQLPSATQLVDRHPTQIFVLDHLAKPKIRSGELRSSEFRRWREQLRELARRPNVFCKLSGLATEADWKSWTIADLRPFVEIAVDCFGPHRLLAGSDWPVCTLACSYGRWWRTLRQLIADLSPLEQERILGGNATEVYRL